MRRGYFVVDLEAVKIKLDPNHKAFDNFDVIDDDYIEGKTRRKPPEFDLHLALYLFNKEHLPPELLEPLEQWVRDNKMVSVDEGGNFEPDKR